MDLNFQGRYLTRNGTLVAVHPTGDGGWQGHKIPLTDLNSGKQQPFEYDPSSIMSLQWNELGKCIDNKGKCNIDFDLEERISGKDTTLTKKEVRGCPECEKERKNDS
jgi:hypothetical protein